ncbi:MAG: class I SAM-dependent methyltransferase [Deltaproteobacteria bacterium]|nr:MAG: class I SAM-dependent methyltransferase [Deltaproteobacteria bacterium]
MTLTPGTTGYSKATEAFVRATQSIAFEDLHRLFLPLLPSQPSHILDVGAGIGRDAFALAEMGHSVRAVEPLDSFRNVGQQLYPHPNLAWSKDALPYLTTLQTPNDSFDFVLVSAVWHHLHSEEKQESMARLSKLLRPSGVLALSLRHGPAGIGTHVFPTHPKETLQTSKSYGLIPLLCTDPQPSLLPRKPHVTWTRIAVQKPKRRDPNQEPCDP